MSNSNNWIPIALFTTTTVALAVYFHYISIYQQLERKKLENIHKRVEKQKKIMSLHDEKVYLNNPDACFHYTVGENNRDEFEDVKVVAKEICPGWNIALNHEIDVKIISGGITNRLFRLIWKDKSVLVRLYGENTEMFIDRHVENVVFATLSQKKFAPTFWGHFENGRIEGWREARPLEPEEMGQTEPIDFISMIAKQVGLLHTMDMPLEKRSDLWEKMDKAAELAIATTFPNDSIKTQQLRDLNLPFIQEKAAWLRTVLPSALNGQGKDLVNAIQSDSISQQALSFLSDIVFCHNDILSGNILYNDAWTSVQIIDYEYGAYNYRGFDFANHFVEHCGFDMDLANYPGPEIQFQFFKTYMSTAAPDILRTLQERNEEKAFYNALYDLGNRFVLAAHLMWGFWAVVQAGFSKIDFDFLHYAKERFEAFDQQRAYFFG